MTRQTPPLGTQTSGSRARIKTVCLSQRRERPKSPGGHAKLRAGWGLVGDSHAGPRHPDRWKVSLLAWESVLKLNQEHGPEAGPCCFAENLSTEGVDTRRRQVGDRLSVGSDVLLEIE